MKKDVASTQSVHNEAPMTDADAQLVRLWAAEDDYVARVNGLSSHEDVSSFALRLADPSARAVADKYGRQRVEELYTGERERLGQEEAYYRGMGCPVCGKDH